MDINFNTDTNRWISAFKTIEETTRKPESSSSSARTCGQADEVTISSQSRQLAARSEDPFSKLEAAFQYGDLQALAEAAKEQAGHLETSWEKVVDPDGSISGAAYVESIIKQYQTAEAAIRNYYCERNQENLSFENPYNHILQKYIIKGSPYYQQGMSCAEREMSFYQERALLWDSHICLNDPYALASSGGPIHIEDADRIARQAVRDKLDELIQEKKEALEKETVSKKDL